MPPDPFFPNPLGNFEPKRPDFDPEIDPDFDYEENLENNCPTCNNQIRTHTIRQLVECALKEVRGGIKI